MKKEWLRFGAPPPYTAVVLVEHRGELSTLVFIWKLSRGDEVVASGESHSSARATRALLAALRSVTGLKV